MLDKTERLEALAPWIGLRLKLSPLDLETLGRAAHLAKADLATQMVVEMTSLQGVMGREYARVSGEPESVAVALSEHYLPRFAGDALPATRPGVALALADRLDSLAGLFAVGLAPTGSSDPYGLRRAALGLVQILLEHKIPFSVREGLAEAARRLPVKASPEALDAAFSFVLGRIQVSLREEGFAYDAVEAVLAERGDDPFGAQVAVEQLRGWLAREDWAHTLDNYARCVRIIRGQAVAELDPVLLQEPAEQALYTAWAEAEKKLSPESSVNELLTLVQALVPVIERFFVDIMVMAEDPALRQARLALLARIAGLTKGIVDLSKLEGF
jgi:glycyl-tRNA synthetase